MDKKSLDEIVEKLNLDFNHIKMEYEQEFRVAQVKSPDSPEHIKIASQYFSELDYISTLIHYINSRYHDNYQVPKMPSDPPELPR